MSTVLHNNALPLTPGDEKVAVADHVEHTDVDINKVAVATTDAVSRPASLRGMSDDEIKLLDKRMVRKLDFVIMPIMGILYIMNCKPAIQQLYLCFHCRMS